MYPIPSGRASLGLRERRPMYKTVIAKLRRKTAPGVHKKLEAGLHSGGGLRSALMNLQPTALEPGSPRWLPDSTAPPGLAPPSRRWWPELHRCRQGEIRPLSGKVLRRLPGERERLYLSCRWPGSQTAAAEPGRRQIIDRPADRQRDQHPVAPGVLRDQKAREVASRLLSRGARASPARWCLAPGPCRLGARSARASGLQ